MGNPQSKSDITKKDIEPSEAHLPSTPICTPKAKVIDCDPRSPSANIVRTPIQGATIHKTDTPIVGVLNSSISDQDSAVNIDPRSPTVEFTRTPIVVGTAPHKIRNKNLDLVKQQLKDFSPMKQNNSSKIGQTPILLGVSPVIKKTDQSQKRKSYIGLLETNLDFTETDLDNFAKQNSFSAKQNNIEEENAKTVEPENNETIASDNEKQIACDVNETEKNSIESFDDKTKETAEETETTEDKQNAIEEKQNAIKEKQNAVEEKQNAIEEKQNAIEEKPISPEKICKNLEITSPIKETLEKISQIDKEIKEVIAISHSPIIEIDEEILSSAFDKKVTSLIYEDHEILKNVIPKSAKTKSENRTPLGERNMNQNTRKSKNKLKVHDKPLNKKDYVVSKIPVFKEKKGKSKLSQQCENTPPRQKNIVDVKARKMQWDADNTLII